MKPDFTPTHRITTDTEGFWVMLTDDGAAYTWAEWNATDNADYEVSEGEWLFQGQPFAGTVEDIAWIKAAAAAGYEGTDYFAVTPITADKTTEKKKVLLRISLCPTDMEVGSEGDMLDESAVLAEIESVAAERWPGAAIEFETLQVGHRQGDKFAECWIDGVRDDEQAQQVLDDIEWSDERLYQ